MVQLGVILRPLDRIPQHPHGAQHLFQPGLGHRVPDGIAKNQVWVVLPHVAPEGSFQLLSCGIAANSKQRVVVAGRS